MGIYHNIAFRRLTENFSELFRMNVFAFYEVFKHISSPHRWQLIRISYKYQPCPRLYGLKKSVGKKYVKHGGFIHYNRLCI